MFTANANNWLLTENVLDPGGQIVASARFDDTNPGEIEGFYFYHYDMRGSTTAIVAPNGSLKTGYSYDEFGNIEQTGSQTFLNDVTFTGSVTDKSTGLQYMNSRFYNPSSGRFLSQDTYTGNPYEPWTQHLYSYSGNNPTSMVDPTGHFFNLIAAAVGAAVGAVVGVVGNGIANAINNKPFFENAGKAALIGAGVGALVGITCGAIAAAGGVSSALASAGAAIKTAAVTVGAAVKTAAAAVTTAAVTAGSYVASQGQRVVEGARNVVQRAGQAISNAAGKVGQVVSNVVDKVKNVGQSITSSNSTVEIAGRGSTGRAVANTLNEQLAMKEVMSNPLQGACDIGIKLMDSRWLASEGWVKMERIVKTTYDNIIIHYNYNTVSKVFDDFKFK